MAGNYTIQANTALSAFVDGENLAVDLDQKRRLNAAQLEQLMMSNEIMRATAQSQVDAALLANEQTKKNIEKTTQDIAASKASVGIAWSADRRQQDIHNAGAAGRALTAEMDRLGLEWVQDDQNRARLKQGKTTEIDLTNARNQYNMALIQQEMGVLANRAKEASAVPGTPGTTIDAEGNVVAGGAGGRSSKARDIRRIGVTLSPSAREYAEVSNVSDLNRYVETGQTVGYTSRQDRPDELDPQTLTSFRSPELMRQIGSTFEGAERVGRGRYILSSGQELDMRDYLSGVGARGLEEFDNLLSNLHMSKMHNSGVALNLLNTYGFGNNFLALAAREATYSADNATTVFDLVEQGIPKEQLAGAIGALREGSRYLPVTSVDGDTMYVYMNPYKRDTLYSSKNAPHNMTPLD